MMAFQKLFSLRIRHTAGRSLYLSQGSPEDASRSPFTSTSIDRQYPNRGFGSVNLGESLGRSSAHILLEHVLTSVILHRNYQKCVTLSQHPCPEWTTMTLFNTERFKTIIFRSIPGQMFLRLNCWCNGHTLRANQLPQGNSDRTPPTFS
jgi:hypothetical protein